jgi:hypothetical protein
LGSYLFLEIINEYNYNNLFRLYIEFESLGWKKECILRVFFSKDVMRKIGYLINILLIYLEFIVLICERNIDILNNPKKNTIIKNMMYF